MKLKNLLLIAALFLNQITIAQTEINQDETAIKTTIAEMLVLIDNNNFKDIVINYADVPEDKKSEMIAFIDEQSESIKTDDRLADLKEALNKALNVTPTRKDDIFIFSLENSQPIVFIKKGDRWLLQN